MYSNDALRLSKDRIRRLHEEAAANNLARAARLARKAASEGKAAPGGNRLFDVRRIRGWSIAGLFTPFRRAVP
jgi:hypothetical protein